MPRSRSRSRVRTRSRGRPWTMSPPETPAAMTRLTYAEAMARGLTEALAGDERVRLIGGDLFGATRHRSLALDLRARFPDRVWEQPIAVAGSVGTGIGAAISGLRPIVHIEAASSSFEAFSLLITEAAGTHYR